MKFVRVVAVPGPGEEGTMLSKWLRPAWGFCFPVYTDILSIREISKPVVRCCASCNRAWESMLAHLLPLPERFHIVKLHRQEKNQGARNA